MELKELFKKMLIKAGSYIVTDIELKSNREVFKNELLFITKEVHFDSVEDIIVFLEERIELIKEQKRWYYLSSKWFYQIKADELALDIATSLVKRFVTGGEGEGQLLAK